MCYTEFSILVHRSGSYYSYIYLMLGELMAFMIGWTMIYCDPNESVLNLLPSCCKRTFSSYARPAGHAKPGCQANEAELRVQWANFPIQATANGVDYWACGSVVSVGNSRLSSPPDRCDWTSSPSGHYTISVVLTLAATVATTVAANLFVAIGSLFTKLMPLAPCITMLTNGILILSLSWATWVRFAVWSILGLFIYFGYGIWHSTADQDPNIDEPLHMLKMPAEDKALFTSNKSDEKTIDGVPFAGTDIKTSTT
ncbi:unnamed protein product [Protopolystoma xenopodis]|uniref:Cationic amino acid transporter C-terminal domain-containing protein n=1 Tax=Protopolystoma xenopodis TaxID=117903 RepID=A0A3S5C3F1_9PLAT|nr:unnamed protein product [Protopolystoma xenopodis]